MTEDEIRVAIVKAVAGLDGYENPNTEKGGYWDRRCEPVFRAFALGRQAISDSAYHHGQADALTDFLDDVQRSVDERRVRLGL